MKLYIIVLAASLGLIATSCNTSRQAATANGIETITMHVNGVCGMCKDRIETAVYNLPGVKTVEWDLDSSILTAVVKAKKVDEESIAKALAEVGHSSDLMAAVPSAYEALPACCKYDDGVEKH